VPKTLPLLSESVEASARLINYVRRVGLGPDTVKQRILRHIGIAEKATINAPAQHP
jgi:hypothetical protein